MIMIDEALDQIPRTQALTHVFAQAGVGSIPAAIYMGIHKRLAQQSLRYVVVEPEEANCVFLSIANGPPTPADGTLKTIMAGLACREISPAARSILQWIVSEVVTITDDAAKVAMLMLAAGNGDVSIVAGESAVGGVATLSDAATDPALRTALGLTDDSEVLLFGCEGASDPAIYDAITGETPEAVFARQTTPGE